ncbi:MAG: glycosyltransferase family 4 protein [Prevotella sp.]|nr:glycosyltransferase family 4 protein [Prevotella sp.]
MKRILCLIDGLGSGGAERQMTGLAVMLKEKGYRVDLVAYHEEKDFYVTLAREGGIEPVFLEVGPSQWSKVKAVRRYIKQQGGYDWIIAYKPGPNAIGCILKLLGMRFKLIVSERITDREVGRKKNLFRLYRFTDYIVPNAYSQGEFLSKTFPWMTKKIVPITNFTDTNYFKPAESSESDIFRVLTVARVAKQKNVLGYLDAIALLKKRGVERIHFDWYGNVERGQDDYAQECYAKVKELGLDEQIAFHLSTSEIVNKYQECDMFCLPSLFEGFPNVLCEAMSCGKPVACGNVCDNARIVANGKNGLLFDPTKVEEIADALQEIINMPEEKRQEWGRNSREIAVELLSKEAFVNKYIEVIERN